MINLYILKAKYFALFSLLLVAFSVSGQEVARQVVTNNTSGWQHAMVNAAGGNYVNGVDVFYKRTFCNSNEQIILKFVNKNSEDVLIEWADGVYTQDKQWVLNERNDKGREIKLKANEEIEGSCESKSVESLRIEVAQYVSDPEMKFKFAPSYIEVTK